MLNVSLAWDNNKIGGVRCHLEMEQDQQEADQEQEEEWVEAEVVAEWVVTDLGQDPVETAFVQVVGQKCLIG